MRPNFYQTAEEKEFGEFKKQIFSLSQEIGEELRETVLPILQTFSCDEPNKQNVLCAVTALFVVNFGNIEKKFAEFCLCHLPDITKNEDFKNGLDEINDFLNSGNNGDYQDLNKNFSKNLSFLKNPIFKDDQDDIRYFAELANLNNQTEVLNFQPQKSLIATSSLKINSTKTHQGANEV